MENMDRRKFLRNAIAAAVAVGGAEAVDAVTNKAEANYTGSPEWMQMEYLSKLTLLFKANERTPKDPQRMAQEFEKYFNQETESYLNQFAQEQGYSRTAAVDALALSTVMVLARTHAKDTRDVQITERLQQEYLKRGVQLARDSQRK